MRAFLIAAIGVLALDQLSKWWIVWHLDLIDRLAIDVIPPLLNLRMGWNYGINFGLFADAGPVQRFALVGLAVGVSLALAIWSRRMPGPVPRLAAGAIAGGALGNAWDRLAHGAVADFLNMSCCGLQNPWTFNIADIAIFAGAAILIIWPHPEAPR
jgi:signal peptidase II